MTPSSRSPDGSSSGRIRRVLGGGLLALALLAGTGCANSATGPGTEECRQVDVLEICPTDGTRVDTTTS